MCLSKIDMNVFMEYALLDRRLFFPVKSSVRTAYIDAVNLLLIRT